MTLPVFREIWAVDFEFGSKPGGRPEPRCMVARELRSRRLLRVWEDELRAGSSCPFSLDHRTLYVAYYASAEMGCHLVLGWSMPEYVIDLFAEFRVQTNGKQLPAGRGLVGAMTYYGLNPIEVAAKEEMRFLALRGGDYTTVEKTALLDYCQSDVDALVELAPHLLSAVCQ